MTDPLEFLGQAVILQIDRPLGSRHPRHGFIYSLNYGFVPGTLAPDGAEVDAYVLGVFEPVEVFQGVCIAVIRRSDDNDDKLIVVPEGDEERYTDAQITALTEFQERFFSSHIIRKGRTMNTPFPKLSQPALRALANAGYTHLEQLAGVGEAELAKLHGMGPNALGKLKEALAEIGLSLTA